MAKKLMALLLTLVMIFSVVPTSIVSVLAKENDIKTVGAVSEDGQTAINGDEILAKMSEFSDVPKDSWYYSSVKYVKENGIFSGTSATYQSYVCYGSR